MTLQGYSELFEQREDASELFSCYETLFKMQDIKQWIAELEPKDRSTPITRLFHLPHELLPKEKPRKSGDIMNILQVFSLLENVYRNVLLRPYIPAYRTINTDCGRYRSFIEPLRSNIFDKLNFEFHPPNLYTYNGTDQSETIKSAVACSILIIYLSKELK